MERVAVCSENCHEPDERKQAWSGRGRLSGKQQEQSGVVHFGRHCKRRWLPWELAPCGRSGKKDVLTLCPEETGAHRLFVDTPKISGEKWRPPLMEEDWIVLCQALYFVN